MEQKAGPALSASQGRRKAELDVVVLGGAAMDWLAEVEALPPADGLVVARRVGKYPGGSAANIAVGLARLGLQVGFVGKIGDDSDGQLLMRAFAQEGVDTRWVVVTAGAPTAACFIAVDDRGDRAIFVLPGASLIETAAELDLSAVRCSRAVLIGPSYAGVALAAARAARASAATVVGAPDGAWTAADLPELSPVLALLDALILSKAEAMALTGEGSPLPAARRLWAAGPPTVVLTLGRDGALLLDCGQAIHVSALPTPAVRDTTGAGDAFSAGLVAGFLEGLDWQAAVRLGNAAAALKIQHIGAREGLPTRAETERYLSRTENRIVLFP